MNATEQEFSQQMNVRDMITDLCAEIDSIASLEERQQIIDYAISQLTDLKAEGL